MLIPPSIGFRLPRLCCGVKAIIKLFFVLIQTQNASNQHLSSLGFGSRPFLDDVTGHEIDDLPGASELYRKSGVHRWWAVECDIDGGEYDGRTVWCAVHDVINLSTVSVQRWLGSMRAVQLFTFELHDYRQMYYLRHSAITRFAIMSILLWNKIAVSVYSGLALKFHMTQLPSSLRPRSRTEWENKK